MEPLTMFLIGTIIKKIVYPLIRPSLKKSIDDPDKVWDDVAMGAADEIFNYNKRRREDGNRNRTI